MRSLLVLLFLAFTVAGCSSHTGNGIDSRVAATVNGVEITQREVNFLYQRSAPPGGDATVARNQRRTILAGLVRGELLAQQATKMKLDKSPDFLLAMHDARRRVLAGFAEQEIASTAKGVSPEIVQQVITNNPNLFAQRKLLVYDEVLMQSVNVPFLQSLNASAANGASLSALLDLVKAQKVPFRQATRTLTTDQMEPAIFTVLSNSKVNRAVVARVADKFSMILVLHSIVPVPLEGQAAMQTAANQINNQQRSVAFSNKMRTVVDASKITYFGEYKPDAPGNKGNQAVALPMPDPTRVQSQIRHQIAGSGSVAVSFTAAILLLFASKSFLSGTLWLPKLWPSRKKKASADNAGAYKYHEHKVPILIKLPLFLIAGLCVVALGYHLLLLRDLLALWMISGSIVAGLLIGTGTSHLYVRTGLHRLTEKMRKFRWVPVMLFAALLLSAGLVVTMRIVNS